MNENLIKPSYFVPEGWGKETTGRQVVISEGNEMAWGIEVDIPVDMGLREFLYDKEGLYIPETIKTITYVTFAPQENLDQEYRTIGQNDPGRSLRLENLVSVTPQSPALVGIPVPYQELETIFTDILENKQKVQELNDILTQKDSEEGSPTTIVIVDAHGGSKNKKELILGEHTNEQPLDDQGNPLQSRGNSINAQKVIDYYDNPQEIAVLLLHVCNEKGVRLQKRNVPLIYPLTTTSPIERQSGLVHSKIDK